MTFTFDNTYARLPARFFASISLRECARRAW